MSELESSGGAEQQKQTRALKLVTNTLNQSNPFKYSQHWEHVSRGTLQLMKDVLEMRRRSPPDIKSDIYLMASGT